jgi:hypothetical protein
MPAWLLWQRITRTAEKQKADAEAKHKERIFDAWLMSKNFGNALQANSDLPPTKEEAKRKKPNWTKIEKVRRDLEAFMGRYQEGNAHPHFYEKFIGLQPSYDPPKHYTKKGSKEHREQRKQQIAEMEARLIRDFRKMAEVHGNVAFDQLQPT